MSCFGLEEVSYKVTQYTVANVVPLWWMCCEWIPTGDNINTPHKFVSVYIQCLTIQPMGRHAIMGI